MNVRWLLTCLFAALLLAASARAQIPIPGGGGGSSAGWIGSTPQAARSNLRLPEVAYATTDSQWGFSSTPASVTAGAPDHLGDMQQIAGPVSTIASNASVCLSCYIGNASWTAASNTFALQGTGVRALWSNIVNSGSVNPLIGQAYQWTIPTGISAGTYTGTITGYTNSGAIILSSGPASDVANLAGMSFAWTPVNTTAAPTANMKVGQALIVPNAATASGSIGSNGVADLVTTIATIPDGYHVTATVAPTQTLQAFYETVMAATDDSAAAALLIGCAEGTTGAPTCPVRAPPPGDFYIQVGNPSGGFGGSPGSTGCYYVPSISAAWANHTRIGSGCLDQGPPSVAGFAHARVDLPVAKQRQPAFNIFRNFLPPAGLPGLSLQRPIEATGPGHSLYVDCCNQPLDQSGTIGQMVDQIILTKRRAAGYNYAADKAISYAVGGMNQQNFCSQVTTNGASPNFIASWPVYQPTVTGLTGSGAGTTTFTVSSTTGITVNMAAAFIGNAYLNPNLTTWVTAVNAGASQITVTPGVPNGIVIPNAATITVMKAWIGDDTHPGYIHDLAPDEVFLPGGGNDGMTFTPERWACMLNNFGIAAGNNPVQPWLTPPKPYIFTDYPWAEGNASNSSNGGFSYREQSQFSDGYIQGWADLHGVPVVPVAAMTEIVERGVDTELRPVVKQRTDMPTYSGEPIVLPWTGGMWCQDWAATFYAAGTGGVPTFFNTLHGGEIQFGIGNTWIDSGNIFRLGLDGSNNLYYEIDSDANTVEVAKTSTAINFTGDTSNNVEIYVAFIGSRAFVQFATSSAGDLPTFWNQVYSGPAPRLRGPFKPRVSHTSGTGTLNIAGVGTLNNETSFMCSAPISDNAFLPIMADFDLAGFQPALGYVSPYGYSPIGPYGSQGQHHQSTKFAQLLYHFLDAQTWVGMPTVSTPTAAITASATLLPNQTSVCFSPTADSQVLTMAVTPQWGVPIEVKDCNGTWGSHAATIGPPVNCGTTLDGNATLTSALIPALGQAYSGVRLMCFGGTKMGAM